MLWRVRTTLADRPGALAALAQRCGRQDVNILGLQIFPAPGGVTDEVVLRAPSTWRTADVARLVEVAGGEQVSVGECTAHALTDPPTRYVRAALRLCDEPAALQEVLADLLDAREGPGEQEALLHRLDVGGASSRAQVRRAVPFTETERARAAALGELAERMLAHREGRGADPSSPGWRGVGEVAPGAAQGSAPQPTARSSVLAAGRTPVVRLGQLADMPAVRRMHERCSAPSLLRRYHAPMPRLTWRTMRRLVAPPDGASLVAVAGTEVVGMAVVAPYGPGVMDVGVLVEDRWQRNGVGAALLHQAARTAVGRGARDLVCVMQPDNEALLPTVQRSGLTCRLATFAGTTEVRIPLRDVPPPHLAVVEPVPEQRHMEPAVALDR